MAQMTPPSGPKSPDPANPYNIDYARERRLKRMFQIWIAVGFIFAIVALIIGFAVDYYIVGADPDAPAVTPYSSPGDSGSTPTSRP